MKTKSMKLWYDWHVNNFTETLMGTDKYGGNQSIFVNIVSAAYI
jgi:hypothetical protein